MKKICIAVTAWAVAASAQAASPKLVKLWETPAKLKVPESVLPDLQRRVLYVSNIDGEPWKKDGKGSIGKVSLDGKILATDWVTGLNAPKGMGIRGNLLYAADLDQLVVIDIEKGQISKKIPIPGASGLNDVTVGESGVIYATDTHSRKVFALEGERPSVFLEKLKEPNGILAYKGVLYLLDGEGMYRVGTDRKLSPISPDIGSGVDGIENVSGNDFLVSRWGGTIHLVHGDGTRQLLLDTEAKEINAADIGYDAKKRIVYVPTFFKNSIVAYELK